MKHRSYPNDPIVQKAFLRIGADPGVKTSVQAANKMFEEVRKELSVSLNPSNLIAEQVNVGKKIFPNLARRGTPEENPEISEIVRKELEDAGIKVLNLPRKLSSEVPTYLLGEIHRWGFRRAWYYYVAEGPGIPPDVAEEFHKKWGTQCRVEGDCGCPSPLEYCQGFAVGTYHIDTQEGLCAFVEMLKSVHKPSKE